MTSVRTRTFNFHCTPMLRWTPSQQLTRPLCFLSLVTFGDWGCCWRRDHALFLEKLAIATSQEDGASVDGHHHKKISEKNPNKPSLLLQEGGAAHTQSVEKNSAWCK